jgi:hypothetical protein
VNNQDKSIEYKLSLNELLPDGDTLEDLGTGKEYQGNNGVFELSIEPYQIMILTGF